MVLVLALGTGHNALLVLLTDLLPVATLNGVVQEVVVQLLEAAAHFFQLRKQSFFFVFNFAPLPEKVRNGRLESSGSEVLEPVVRVGEDGDSLHDISSELFVADVRLDQFILAVVRLRPS